MSRCVDCGNGRLSQSGPVEAARVVTSSWPVIAGRFMVPSSPGVALCPTWGAAAECGVSHSQPSDAMETCSLRGVHATTTTEEKNYPAALFQPGRFCSAADHRPAEAGSPGMTDFADPEAVKNFNLRIVDEFRANGGKVTGPFTQADLLLTTTGGKSGQRRVSPLAYFHIDDKLIVIGSFHGASVNPNWVHNLPAARTAPPPRRAGRGPRRPPQGPQAHGLHNPQAGPALAVFDTRPSQTSCGA